MAARTTQAVAETLATGYAKIRASQAVAETLATGYAKIRASQAVVEVLYSDVPPPVAQYILNTTTATFNVQLRFFTGPMYDTLDVSPYIIAFYRGWNGTSGTVPTDLSQTLWTEITELVHARGELTQTWEESVNRWTATLEGQGYNGAYLAPGKTIACFLRITNGSYDSGWYLYWLGRVQSGQYATDYQRGDKWRLTIECAEARIRQKDAPRLVAGPTHIEQDGSVTVSSTLSTPEAEIGNNEFIGTRVIINANNVIDGNKTTLWCSQNAPTALGEANLTTDHDLVDEFFFKPITGYNANTTWWVELVIMPRWGNPARSLDGSSCWLWTRNSDGEDAVISFNQNQGQVTASSSDRKPVVSVSMTNGGSGYTSTPLVYFSSGGGSGAMAVAHIANGAVISVTVTAGGEYTTDPDVSFSGGGGSGATADVSLAGGGGGSTQYTIEAGDRIIICGNRNKFEAYTGGAHGAKYVFEVSAWHTTNVIAAGEFGNTYKKFDLHPTAGYLIFGEGGYGYGPTTWDVVIWGAATLPASINSTQWPGANIDLTAVPDRRTDVAAALQTGYSLRRKPSGQDTNTKADWYQEPIPIPGGFWEKNTIEWLQLNLPVFDSKLTNEIQIDTASVPLDVITGWPTSGTAICEADTFTYTGITGTTLTGCVGVLAHSVGAQVYPYVESAAQYGWPLAQVTLVRKVGTSTIAKGRIFFSNITGARTPNDTSWWADYGCTSADGGKTLVGNVMCIPADTGETEDDPAMTSLPAGLLPL